MAALLDTIDFWVTEEKLAALLDRIVTSMNPLQVIAFGSRARGQHRPDSDLDLAIIVDAESRPRPGDLRGNILLPADIVVLSEERFKSFKPWINTIDHEIDREGVRLYERGSQSADRNTLHRLCA